MGKRDQQIRTAMLRYEDRMAKPVTWACSGCGTDNAEANSSCHECGLARGANPGPQTETAPAPEPVASETAVPQAALAKVERAPVSMTKRGVQLQSLEDLYRFSMAIHKSGLAPKGMGSPEKIMVALEAGIELGLAPMRALGCMTVINGRAAPMGDAARAIIINSGVLKRGTTITTGVELGPKGLEDDTTRGWAMGTRADTGIEATSQFTVAEAKRAKKWKGAGPWTEYPERMLAYRALGFLARDVFADVMHGFVVAEELGDYPTPVQAEGVATSDAPPAEDDPLLAEVVE